MTLLSELLAQEGLPEAFAGPLTAPSSKVRMLHATAHGGTPGDIPEVFHLTGCVSCKNTAEVMTLNQQVKSAESRLETVVHEIEKALGEGDGMFGKTYSLASVRSNEDPDWGLTDTSWDDDDEEASPVVALVDQLSSAHRAKLFQTGEYGRKTPSKDLVLVSPHQLVHKAPELVISQVPLRIDLVADDMKVLVSVPKKYRENLVDRHALRYGLPTFFPTTHSAEKLSTPEYGDTWRLAMEILGSQVEESQRAQDGRKIDLDSVLEAAEAALA